MSRFCCAFLFLIAVSVCLHADCKSSKDRRTFKNKQAGIGVEVVDVNLVSAAAVDSALLPRIISGLIGSCFNDKPELERSVYGGLGAAGYESVRIEDLRIETINPASNPTSVQVNGTVTEVIEGPKCPTDTEALYQFLLDHRSNSLEADAECVDVAFIEMGLEAKYRNNRFYTKALVDLLDFERKDENVEFAHHFIKYPAMERLHFPAAVPYLVDAIKQSDSELVRTNAADTIFFIYRGCTAAAVARLNHEAKKPETTFEQRTRLQIAAEFERNYYPDGPGPCNSEYGEPSTVEEVEKNLFSPERE